MKTLLLTLTTLFAINGFSADKTIVRGTDRFELVYQLTVPELSASGRLWIPLAKPDAHQKFEVLTIQSPIAWHRAQDATGRNDILVFEPGPADQGQRITLRYQVTRKEKRAHREAGDPKVHLRAERLVPLNARYTTRRVEGAWWPPRSSKPLSVRDRAEVGSIPTLSANFPTAHD